jgi:hypothetical protein
MKYNLLKSALIFTTIFVMTAQAQEKTYSLSLSNPAKKATLDIEVHNGSVSVIGYEGKTVEISATISPIKEGDLNKHQTKMRKKIKQKLTHHQATKSRSTEGLKSIKSSMLNLEIEEEDNEVDITSQSMNQHVDLIIKVPTQSAVSVELYQGGDIKVNKVKGELELESFGGGVYANEVSGPIVAETYTHDIVIEFNAFNNKTPTSLTSHAGNVDVSLAKTIKANVNVQTYQGEIFSGLSSEFIVTDEIKKSKNGEKQQISIGGAMQAKVNGGGQTMSLITYMGNLYIRQAK